MSEETRALLSRILYLSNIDHCEDYKDLIRALEKIHDAISEAHPDIEEDN